MNASHPAIDGKYTMELAHSGVGWTTTTRRVVVTGGAGFIGTNLAFRLLSRGQKVTIFDNLSRKGVKTNLNLLTSRFGTLIEVMVADIRDPHALNEALRDASFVFHLAGQVAVTTSLQSPTDDFDINARGTLNILETLRRLPDPPVLLFTSTNKVYGCLDSIPLDEELSRYQPRNPEIRRSGISEDALLAFRSPYGCSKGTADQYVLDYSNSFGLRALVFRMSCIYGSHQCGTEDQGWVTHFLSRALDGEPLTIYGDGKQVRDILFVDDLVDAMLLAFQNIDQLTGRAFNIGGGPTNAISLIELIDLMKDLGMPPPGIVFAKWRTSDQRYYVSDTGRFRHSTGWKPRVGVRAGIQRLHRWMACSESANPNLLAS